MLKLGIVSVAQLDRPLTWLGKKKHASLLLLRELSARGSQDAAHYDAVINHVLTANGTDDPRDVLATIYADDAGALRPVHRLNGGYEAEHLVATECEAGRATMLRTG